jgi:hypothetical protein
VVECQLPKLDVEGSNPFARFNLRQQGPEAAKTSSGPSFWFESEGPFGARKGRLHHGIPKELVER